MSEARIEALEARVSSLELQVNALRQQILTTTGPARMPQATAVVKPQQRWKIAAAESARVPAPQPARMTAEAFFGGRFLLGAGVLAFLIGVGFFLKYAFDNGWIGPSGRVALGLLSGIAMMIAGDRMFRGNRRTYAAAISGLGAAILYLSLWAAGAYFHLVPLGVTFAAMLAVTAATMTIAIRRDVQALAFAAVSGALLTPVLSAGPTWNITALLVYLALMNVALLWLPAKRWPQMEALALAGSQLYLLIEMPSNVTLWDSVNTTVIIFATIFLVQFTAMPLVRAYRTQKTASYEIVMVLVSASVYYLELFVQLYSAHRHWLTAASVVLAVVYLLVARRMSGPMRHASAAIALGFITIGAGVTFTGASMALAWSVEAAALLIAGTRMQSPVTRAFGYIAYFLTFFAIDAQHPAGGTLFLNERFATLLVTGLGLGLVAWTTRHEFDESTSLEQYVPLSAEVLAHFLVLLAFGYEISGAFADSPLAISLLMLVYAAVLVLAGFLYHRLFTRWEGLALFGALLLKVFLVDLSSLDTIVRIVSFLAVGSVLLAVALLYQRAQAKEGQT